MRRSLSMILVLCLFVPSLALADARPPLRLGDNITVSDYWKNNGIPTTERYFAPFATGQDKLAQLQGDRAPDLFGLDTWDDDFAAFKGSGMLSDLSGSEVIRDAVSRMRPETRQVVTAADGSIIGPPVIHMLYPCYWSQEAWDAAGLTAENVPQSYVELLDLLEAWAARVSAHPETSVCVSAPNDCDAVPEQADYSAWLVGLLLTTWETQQRYAGEEVRFDTPEMIALAERARDVGEKLYQAEPSRRKRQKMLHLFDDQTRSPGAYANGGSNYGLSHTIPLRITADQPKLMRGAAVVQCVRAGSAWLDETLGFIAEDMANTSWAFQYSLYLDFLPGKYEGNTVSAGWMADLAAYDGTIVYLTSGFDEQKETYELPFAKGEITAKQLVEGLDSRIQD